MIEVLKESLFRLGYIRHSFSHLTQPGHSSALVPTNILSTAAIKDGKFQSFC